MYITENNLLQEKQMIADKKTFTAGLLIFLALLIAGIIQLSPPETPKSAPDHYFRNVLLALDLLEESTYRKVPNAKPMLMENLRFWKRDYEAALWEKYGENL